jgi:hypothetical protein
MATSRHSAGDDRAAPSQLSLRDVVLFSSGVGYFERTGKISGSATVDLHFRTEHINDILKSLVLFDANGNVQPVTYTTKDSITKRLRSAGMDIGKTFSMGRLLRQFQGAEISLEIGGKTKTGRIVSVSTNLLPPPGGEKATVLVELINLLTDGGLCTIALDKVSHVKLLDENLNCELQQNLELLAGSLDNQRRLVQLRFNGDTTRAVRAGYLQEVPLWKTSYRLVLGKKQKPYVQGWAIVENTTDEDWQGVRLSLVSGWPVSFVQDLYQPLYVTRPEVAPQIIGSASPQLYEETWSAADTAPVQDALALQTAGDFEEHLDEVLGMLAPVEADPTRKQTKKAIGVSAQKLSQSVANQARGAARGDLFEYSISQPVTLPKQQAAMVPIVSENVEGEAVSIYDPAADSAHAMRGFQLRNSTKLHLAGGPITVFQDGVYAGDAQITNLQPAEERLISYAVDLDLAVSTDGSTHNHEMVSISVKGGVLHVKHQQSIENIYTFRNKLGERKRLLLIQARKADYTLVEPRQPMQETKDEYHFELELGAKKTIQFQTVEQRSDVQQYPLAKADIAALITQIASNKLSPQLKEALQPALKQRTIFVNMKARRAALEDELKEIDREQARIRQNMTNLDQANALYQQYVHKLTTQEEQIEKLRSEISELRANEQAAAQEMRQQMESLNSD